MSGFRWVKELRIKELRFCVLIQSIGVLFLRGRAGIFRESHGIKRHGSKGSLQMAVPLPLLSLILE
jgi:hypothetical protein